MSDEFLHAAQATQTHFRRILQSIDDLTAAQEGNEYTDAHMRRLTWADLRGPFRVERLNRKLTQTEVGLRAGLDQSAISKIESDPKYTPLVDTFVAAIHGLGLSAAEFFARIEGLPILREGSKTIVAIPPDAPPASPRAPLTEDVVTEMLLALAERIQDLAAAHHDRTRARDAVRGSAADRQTAPREDSRLKAKR